MDDTKSVFDSLSPKFAFYAGLVGGILLIGTIGFEVMLGLYVRGESNPSSATNTNNEPTQVVDNGSNPPPSQPAGELPPVTDADHVTGNKNAAVTVIEYSDYECPFCERFHPSVQQVLKEFGDKVRVVYRHFPLDSIHQKARPFAEASECIAKLKGNDAFWKFTDTVFSRGGAGAMTLEDLPKLAKDLGVGEKAFSDCQKSDDAKKRVENQYQGGITAGVRGTPGSFINGTEVPGAVPYEQLKQMVETALKK